MDIEIIHDLERQLERSIEYGQIQRKYLTSKEIAMSNAFIKQLRATIAKAKKGLI